MNTPTIYGFNASTYVWTARAALNTKQVPHHFVAITVQEAKAPEHLARHPFGKVPALQHGDLTLYETSAITRYVDTAFDGPALMPADAAQAARADQWISVTNSYLYPSVVPRYILQYIFPRGAGGAPDRATIEAAVPEIQRVVSVLEGGLSDGPWLVGDRLTLADLFVGPLLFGLSRFPEGAALLEGAAGCQRLMAALQETPSFISAAPRG